MMSGHYDESFVAVEQIAAELRHCRQRGLERLDRATSRQSPVPAPGLESLAQRYLSARQTAAPDRVARIKTLLRHAVDELSRQGHQQDAMMIRDLFFGESTHTIVLSAGELLSTAFRNSGELSEVRFRERRLSALRTFAGFLLQFVDAAERGVADPEQPGDGKPNISELIIPASAPVADADAGLAAVQVSAGYVSERADRFVQLLALARNVTIIGFTHEQLATSLAQALELKKARSEGFWSSLRIVFLSDALLDYVNDERVVSPDHREAVKERRQGMTWGRRSVRLLLRRTSSTRWELFESPYLPPFAGTLFQLPGGRHLVQLIIRRPRWSTTEQLFFEFEDLADEYMTGAFEDAVRNSISENRAVPTGLPGAPAASGGVARSGGAAMAAPETFQCRWQRNRLDVLVDGSNERTWLPMVLVITTQHKGGRSQPVLQLRTEGNAAREIDRISHLSGHIFGKDYSQSAGSTAIEAPATLDIGSGYVIRAAQHRVQVETGDDVPPGLVPVTTGRYVNYDKENLFFFVYRLDLLDEDGEFPARSEMHLFPLPELLAIRANQTLRLARRLCETRDLSPRLWAAATEIVSANLTLHHYDELAARVQALTYQQASQVRATVSEIEDLIDRTAVSCTSLGRETIITGMSGWQYREFFRLLLPVYEAVGVAGAAAQIAVFNDDEKMASACDLLMARYADEELMRQLRLEL